MNLKTLITVSMLILLTACTSNQPEPLPGVGDYTNPTSDAMVCRIPYEVEPLSPIVWRDFQWKILNTEIVKEMIANDQPIRYYALTPSDFQNLSLTTNDILRYINVQQEQLDQIVEYYSKDD